MAQFFFLLFFSKFKSFIFSKALSVGLGDRIELLAANNSICLVLLITSLAKALLISFKAEACVLTCDFWINWAYEINKLH